MRKQIILSIALSAVFSTMTSSYIVTKDCNPGSLWDNGARNPFIDRVASKEGDIITIVVSENSSANYATSMSAMKKDSNAVQFNFQIPFIDDFFAPASNSADNKNYGTGTSTQTNAISTTMAAVIKEVLPGDRFIIEATRNITVNKEVQTFKLTGVIRKDDINPNNTISSINIAEADLKMIGKGVSQDRMRRGLITTILDWLF